MLARARAPTSASAALELVDERRQRRGALPRPSPEGAGRSAPLVGRGGQPQCAARRGRAPWRRPQPPGRRRARRSRPGRARRRARGRRERVRPCLGRAALRRPRPPRRSPGRAASASAWLDGPRRSAGLRGRRARCERGRRGRRRSSRRVLEAAETASRPSRRRVRRPRRPLEPRSSNVDLERRRSRPRGPRSARAARTSAALERLVGAPGRACRPAPRARRPRRRAASAAADGGPAAAELGRGLGGREPRGSRLERLQRPAPSRPAASASRSAACRSRSASACGSLLVLLGHRVGRRPRRRGVLGGSAHLARLTVDELAGELGRHPGQPALDDLEVALTGAGAACSRASRLPADERAREPSARSGQLQRRVVPRRRHAAAPPGRPRAPLASSSALRQPATHVVDAPQAAPAARAVVAVELLAQVVPRPSNATCRSAPARCSAASRGSTTRGGPPAGPPRVLAAAAQPAPSGGSGRTVVGQLGERGERQSGASAAADRARSQVVQRLQQRPDEQGRLVPGRAAAAPRRPAPRTRPASARTLSSLRARRASASVSSHGGLLLGARLLHGLVGLALARATASACCGPRRSPASPAAQPRAAAPTSPSRSACSSSGSAVAGAVRDRGQQLAHLLLRLRPRGCRARGVRSRIHSSMRANRWVWKSFCRTTWRSSERGVEEPSGSRPGGAAPPA